MKNFALFLVLLCFTVGCSNDFDLVDNWKDIPVVYGVLNQQDAAHYIKVEKAFLDQETSAITIAQIPDSLYYDNITVALIEKTPLGGVVDRYELQLMDAADDGLPKDPGTFANSPNWVYKTTEILNPTRTYELEINRGDGSDLLTATTELVEDFFVSQPKSSQVAPSFRLKFEPNKNTDFKFDKTDNSRFFDLTLRIHYTEYNDENPGVAEAKFIDWPIIEGKAIEPRSPSNPQSNSENNIVSGDAFYSFVASSLPADVKYCRLLDEFELRIDVGSIELYNYTSVGLANLGITGSVPLPSYTNLSEGRGIFASRYTKIVPEINVDPEVHFQLENNDLTKDLNFRNPAGNPCE